jgi:hypothetical protein
MPANTQKSHVLHSDDGPLSLEEILQEALVIGAGVKPSRKKQLPVDLINIGLASQIKNHKISNSWLSVLRCIITDPHITVGPDRFPFVRVHNFLNPTGLTPVKAFWIGRAVDVDVVKKRIVLPDEKVIQLEGSLRETNAHPTETLIAIVEVVKNIDHSTSFHDAVFHAVPTATRWWP